MLSLHGSETKAAQLPKQCKQTINVNCTKLFFIHIGLISSRSHEKHYLLIYLIALIALFGINRPKFSIFLFI